MTGDVLLQERRGAVSVLTLNRPEVRNALNLELLDAMRAATDAAVADPEVRAVVLTGTGDKAFCAGMDLKAFVDGSLPSTPAVGDSRGASPLLSWDLAVPVIGAINGPAVAGGFEVMMACDVVVAADHAVFGLSEVKRGLIPGGGGTVLGSRVPLAIALELALTGDNIDAERALAIGLVNRVVPRDRVLDEALAVATRIAENGPMAVRTIKELMRRGARDGAASAWPDAVTMQRIFGSDDAREGASAFIEKRAPRWTGS